MIVPGTSSAGGGEILQEIKDVLLEWGNTNQLFV